MRHRLRRFGHECDRFVVRGLECPFAKLEEEEDDDDDEDPEEEEKERVPVPSFDQVERPGIFVPARRDETRGERLFREARDAVSRTEMEKALEAIGEEQEEGEFRFIPTAEELRSALTGRTAQGIMAVLSALAVTAAFRGMPAGRLATPSLAVAHSERQAARVLSGPVSDFGIKKRRAFFGFGPVGAIDSFNETGFN